MIWFKEELKINGGRYTEGYEKVGLSKRDKEPKIKKYKREKKENNTEI